MSPSTTTPDLVPEPVSKLAERPTEDSEQRKRAAVNDNDDSDQPLRKIMNKRRRGPDTSARPGSYRPIQSASPEQTDARILPSISSVNQARAAVEIENPPPQPPQRPYAFSDVLPQNFILHIENSISG
ncbi:hypothetical protein IL306_010552 [Fusarium sp. DS 682]|nr:hypothetical protein IL306_010552 [Fusarium sp. DS 682]